MQIVWNGTSYPHGWRFDLPGPNPVWLVAGGVAPRRLDLCDGTAYSLLPRRDAVSLLPDRTAYSLLPARQAIHHCED